MLAHLSLGNLPESQLGLLVCHRLYVTAPSDVTFPCLPVEQ